jgi:hypothetical protein
MAAVQGSFIPFEASFELGAIRSDLIAVSRAEAEDVARAEGLRVRILELHWRRTGSCSTPTIARTA